MLDHIVDSDDDGIDRSSMRRNACGPLMRRRGLPYIIRLAHAETNAVLAAFDFPYAGGNLRPMPVDGHDDLAVYPQVHFVRS